MPSRAVQNILEDVTNLTLIELQNYIFSLFICQVSPNWRSWPQVWPIIWIGSLVAEIDYFPD
jgi:hypothetical protein